ncbi:MAG: polysaccharide deacetylase family protein [Candidatus Firestonebacteria bacterium]|nr:polysaccharide deacetylase family protein [Candidatus Firestonebacteria bacterium]
MFYLNHFKESIKWRGVKVNNNIKHILYKIGYPQTLIENSNNSHVIIAYHGVVDKIRDPIIDTWCVTTEELFKQISVLQKYFDIVTLKRLIEIIKKQESTDKPVAVITFDDAYEGVYLNAYPILKEKNIPFLVCFPSGLIGTSEIIWAVGIDLIIKLSMLKEVIIPSYMGQPEITFPLKNIEQRISASFKIERLSLNIGGDYGLNIFYNLIEQCGLDNYKNLLKEYSHFKIMSIPQAQEMVANGVEPAVHGRFHLPLNTTDDLILGSEIVESRKELSAKLNVNTVDHFCLCHGAFNSKSMYLIKQSGYKSCLTYVEHRRVKLSDSPYNLCRIEGNCTTEDLIWSIIK